MASFTITGSDGLNVAFKKSEKIPENVKVKALNAMGSIAAQEEKRSGESFGVRDPNSNVHILDSLMVNKPEVTDSGGIVTITFKGTRPNGKKTVRNAEIAFIQEYGRKNAPARPFIRAALERNEQKINEAGEKIIQDFIEGNFNE